MSKQRQIRQRKTAAGIAWPRILLRLILVMLLPGAGRALGEAAVSKEYQIKAAFLYNFAQFVEWPTNTFTNVDESFSIGVLGADPFGRALEDTVRGETIQKHRMIIQRSQRLEDLQGCQILFISKSEKGRLAEILTKLGGGRILTVSEVPGFATHGGVINFYLEGNKVRFEINPVTARQGGLKISSQLLSVGKLVGSPPADGVK